MPRCSAALSGTHSDVFSQLLNYHYFPLLVITGAFCWEIPDTNVHQEHDQMNSEASHRRYSLK